MKKSLIFITTLFMATLAFAQSDDDLFGGDDDFFEDDGIIELTENTSTTATKNSDLANGVLFANGSIKVGGNFDLGIATATTLYADDDKDFGEHFKDTTLTPTANANLSVDARPTEILRMYTKFGIKYPYQMNATSYAQTTGTTFTNPFTQQETTIYDTKVQTSISEWFTLKELFSDFSIADRVFFRFGLHTVSWGAGYFFSPVSDIINTSSIDPEDPTKQVNGSLNLRTQIIFPGTQNCLWFYVIPSNDFSKPETYARDTALAGKGEILIGNWELGAGAYWKYQNAPKVMITATGGISDINLFGEALYQYGTTGDWLKSDSWEDKKNVIQLTAGFNYYWKDPAITLMGQYYFNNYHDDFDITKLSSAAYLTDYMKNYAMEGHNMALAVNFGKIFGNTDVTASLFGMMNVGRSEFSDEQNKLFDMYGFNPKSLFQELTISAMLNYSPVKNLSFTCGPYFTWVELDSSPRIDLKLSAKLGGGKF